MFTIFILQRMKLLLFIDCEVFYHRKACVKMAIIYNFMLDKNFWGCNITCWKKKKLFRIANWFNCSKILLFFIALRVINWWGEELPSIWCEHHLNTWKVSVADCNSYMFKVLSEFMTEHLANKEASSKTVEIDESLFVKWNYKVGRILQQQWNYRGIFRDDHEYLILRVGNKKAKTPMQDIKDDVNER